MLGTALFLIVACIIAREVRLAWWLRGTTRIDSRKIGFVRIELRRRVAMHQLPQHVSQFPVPREERILLSRLFGCVLRHRAQSVALPDAACTHLADITPQEFDREFPTWARVLGQSA